MGPQGNSLGMCQRGSQKCGFLLFPFKLTCLNAEIEGKPFGTFTKSGTEKSLFGTFTKSGTEKEHQKVHNCGPVPALGQSSMSGLHPSRAALISPMRFMA